MKKIILSILILLCCITEANAVTLTQRLGSEEVRMTVLPGEVVTLKFTSKEGFQFKNWTVEEGSASISPISATISFPMPNQNVTIRGNYDTHYTVTYNSNGGNGSMTTQSIVAGASGKLSKNTFSKSGVTFEGWAESAGGSVVYNDEDNITPTNDITLYAVWKEKRITVTYNANGGSFDSGNTNIMTYTPIDTVKTSKTSNVSDDGTTADTDTGYGDSQEITDVVTIAGADALEVTITYQTQSTSYDWVCIYDGSVTPSSSNYISSVSGKLGGTTKTTKTYTVSGDTAQFYFKSNSSTCNYYGYYATVKGLTLTSGEYKTPGKTGYVCVGWSTSSSAASREYTNNAFIPIENTTLYAVWKEAIAEKALAVGDYVTYNPTNTTCDLTTITGVSQTAFNPSSTTAWRVLSNNGTTVELVSAEGVGNLTLGKASKKATDGTFSRGTEEDMELAKSNYARAVKILNEISETYVNPTLATGGRGLGYVAGSSMEEIDTETYPLTWDYTYTQGNNGFPYEDSYYSTDVNTLENNGMLHSSGYVWLASRYMIAFSSSSYFSVSFKGTGSSITSRSLFEERSDGYAYSYAISGGVRPVVILKSGLSITGGGTETNPWQFAN